MTGQADPLNTVVLSKQQEAPVDTREALVDRREATFARVCAAARALEALEELARHVQEVQAAAPADIEPPIEAAIEHVRALLATHEDALVGAELAVTVHDIAVAQAEAFDDEDDDDGDEEEEEEEEGEDA